MTRRASTRKLQAGVVSIEFAVDVNESDSMPLLQDELEWSFFLSSFSQLSGEEIFFVAPSSSSGRQCGVDWTDASSCGHGACPGGLNSECAGNLKCFGEVESCTEPFGPSGAPSISARRHCGMDWTDASSCGHGTCPGGQDSECADNLKCFGGVDGCSGPAPSQTALPSTYHLASPTSLPTKTPSAPPATAQ